MSEDLEFYLNLPYAYKVTPDSELGYYIEIPDLPGCRGDGKTIDEALDDITETKRLWLETALEKGYEIPVPRETKKYSGQFLLRMPVSLHQAIAEEASWENVSMNQYLNTLVTECRHVRAIMHTHRAVGELQETVATARGVLNRISVAATLASSAHPVEVRDVRVGDPRLEDAA